MALPTVLVTGATGQLGRAICDAFRASPAARFSVLGTSFSRPGPDLVPLDVRDAAAIDRAVGALPRGSVVIHAAAERKPNVCEGDEAASEALNIDSVWHLGRAAARAGVFFVHISTDYVFDGTSPPYKEGAPGRPLNAYGRQKLRGEHAAFAAHPSPFILRVPVLFGPTTDAAESAITCFVKQVLGDGPAVLDDSQVRVPTFTPDVAATLVNVAHALLECATDDCDNSFARAQARGLGGLFHYSSEDRFTRFTAAQRIAQILGRSAPHVTGDPAPPASGAPRPHDAQLDCGKLRDAKLAAPCTPFDTAMRSVLAGLGLVAACGLRTSAATAVEAGASTGAARAYS